MRINLILFLLIIPCIYSKYVDYSYKIVENRAIFQTKHQGITINGLKGQEILVDLKCGWNKIRVENWRQGTTAWEMINNCKIGTSRIIPVNDFGIPVNQSANSLVILKIGIKYEPCFNEQSIDECFSHVEFIQDHHSEYSTDLEPCLNGYGLLANAICTRKKDRKDAAMIILDETGRKYDGEKILVSSMNLYKISKFFSIIPHIRSKREAKESYIICELTTSTVLPTTTTQLLTTSTMEIIGSTFEAPPEIILCEEVTTTTTLETTTTLMTSTTSLTESTEAETTSTEMSSTGYSTDTSTMTTMEETTTEGSTTEGSTTGVDLETTVAGETTPESSQSSDASSTTTEESPTAPTTTAEPTTTKSSTTTTTLTTPDAAQFDFHLPEYPDWIADIHNTAESMTIRPVATVSTSFVESVTYECRTDDESEFLPARDLEPCFIDSASTRLLTWSNEVTMSPISAVFKGAGTYYIRITARESGTQLSATHILTVNIAAETTTAAEATEALTTTESLSSTQSTSTTTKETTTMESKIETSSGMEDLAQMSTETPESEYDFELEGISTWETTINFDDVSFSIVPIANRDQQYAKMSYECRSSPEAEFQPAKQSDCFNFDTPAMRALTFSSQLEFSPVSSAFASPGSYEIRIRLTNAMTGETAEHVLRVNVVAETTQGVTSSEAVRTSTTTLDKTPSTTSLDKTPSTTASTTASTTPPESTISPTSSSLPPSSTKQTETTTTSTTIDPTSQTTKSSSIPTTTSTPSESTTSTRAYDFHLIDLTWNETIRYSDSTPFTIDPMPNFDANFKKISYECRILGDQRFKEAKMSDCFKFETSAMKMLTFRSSITLSPVSSAFVSPGSYEIRINVTNALTDEQASHVLIVNVVPDLTTSAVGMSTSQRTTSESTTVSTTKQIEDDIGTSEAQESTEIEVEDDETSKTSKPIITTEMIQSTQGSTRTTRILSTTSPLSPSEAARIEKKKNEYEDKINSILNRTNELPMNNTDEFINSVLGLEPDEILDVAKMIASNQLDIGNDTVSSIKLLEQMRNSIADRNSKLADDLEQIITDLANVKMTSSEQMNAVLGALDLALQGSTVFTIESMEDGSLDGSYKIIYGYIRTDSYSLIISRASLTVYGSMVYISGDVRGAYIQDTNDRFYIKTNLNKLGYQADFQESGRTASAEKTAVDEIEPLVDQQARVVIPGSTFLFAEDYIEDSLSSTLWNVTFDIHAVDDAQAQENASVSFWLPVTDAVYRVPQDPGILLKLKSLRRIESEKFTFNVIYKNNEYTIEAGKGVAKFVVVHNNTSIFTYFSKEIIVKPTDENLLEDMLQAPIIIENIDTKMFDQYVTGDLVFNGFNENSMRMVLSAPDNKLPQISATNLQLQLSTFQTTEALSSEQIQERINTNEPMEINGRILLIGDAIDVDGYQLYIRNNIIYFFGVDHSLIIESAKYRITSLALGGYGIQITEGKYTPGSVFHTRSFIEISKTQKIQLTDGTIVRNGSSDYVIYNSNIETEGNVVGSKLGLTPQSLMNQESQRQISTILNNTKNFLENHGKSMSDEQLQETSDHLLSIAGSITGSLKSTLNNPLSSDLAKNLLYATDNYDDLYNVLPSDPDNIVYVEEMTEEQWASYVTLMIQKQIAKQLADSLESTLGALEDTIAYRAIASGNLPFNYSTSAGGTGMTIIINSADQVAHNSFACNEWIFRLPAPVSSWNSERVQSDTLVQVGLTCYTENPRAYVDNFDLLITSGALEAHLKDENQKLIKLENTSKPIEITGRGMTNSPGAIYIYPNKKEEYTLLDVHTFRTTSWNNSMQIEVGGVFPAIVRIFLQAAAATNYIPAADEQIFVFSAFQRLPGPSYEDHDWYFEMTPIHELRTYHIGHNELFNNTGLFYVGIGKMTSNGSVDYGSFDGKPWRFDPSLMMDYEVRLLTKGCYYYEPRHDGFTSDGLMPAKLDGAQYAKCDSNHLSLFSIGVFSPRLDIDGEYEYVVQKVGKNMMPTLSTLFLLILFGSIMLCNMSSENADRSHGCIRYLKDNEPSDGYMYIIAVETGYRMFATTDSTISFNLSGTEGEQIYRSFDSLDDGRFEYPFIWGSTSRFLMTTAYPLGDIEYCRVWIQEAGLEHRESWFNNRIMVKDLQTQNIYHFPFSNWLGTKNGDGETERLAKVETKHHYLNEAMSLHMLAQTCSWFAAFTGGGNRLRQRVTRYDYTSSIIAAMVLVNTISTIICQHENFDNIENESLLFVVMSVGYKDIIAGLGYALLVTFLASIHVILSYNCRSGEEQKFYEKRRKTDKSFKDPGKSFSYLIKLISRSFCMTVIILGSIYNLTKTMDLSSDASNAYFIRFLVMFTSWIVIFEPIKGVIMAYVILKTNKSHKISTKLEEALLPIRPLDSFPRNPHKLIETNIGKEIADVTKLRDTEDRKMRDEQLFITIRDMIAFFISLYIMVMLTYYCRDRHGYYYQEQMSNTLNIHSTNYGDGSFMAIRNSDDFWNWAENTLARQIRVAWYDGKPAYDMRAFLNDKVSRSMGNGLIRQVRNKQNSTCVVSQFFNSFIDNCDNNWSHQSEETQPMSPGWIPVTDNSTEIQEGYGYSTAEKLMTRGVSGILNNYGGGGYTISLSGTLRDLQAKFQKLRNEGWIDRQTRAVVIEFAQYNAQINYFSIVQLLLEIPNSGIYMPNSWIESVRLIKSQDNVVQYYEMLYIGFSTLLFLKELIFYVYGRYKAIRSTPKTRNPIKLLSNFLLRDFSPWQLMDIIVGVLAMASVVAYILRESYTNSAMQLFDESNGNTYINLSVQRDTELAFTYCLAGTVFFTACKMIRILRFNRRIGVLAATLDNALVAILSFCAAFLVFCASFSSLLFILLGNKVNEYRTIVSVFETALAGMLGKFNIKSVVPISQFGSIVAVIYTLLGSKMILQLYVTIIMYEFEQVRTDSERQTNDYEILDHLRYKAKRRLGLLQPKDAPPVSIPDSQKDFRVFHNAVAKVNLLEHRVIRVLHEHNQYMNNEALMYNSEYSATDAIEK